MLCITEFSIVRASSDIRKNEDQRLGHHGSGRAATRRGDYRSISEWSSSPRSAASGRRNAVDGKAVRTPVELAAELSSRKVGDKVRLGFSIRGQWQSGTGLTLGGRQ